MIKSVPFLTSRNYGPTIGVEKRFWGKHCRQKNVQRRLAMNYF